MDFARALDDLRLRGSLRIAGIRLGAVLAFFAIAAVLGFAFRQRDWRVYLPLLAPYVLLSWMCWLAGRRGQFTQLARAAMPFADVLIVYLLQTRTLPVSPSPAGVAGFSLGLFVFVDLLAALTLTPRLILATATLSWLCEGLLQRQAAIGAGAIVAAGVVLFFCAGLTIWSAQRLEELVSASVREQVAREVAIAHSARLEAARQQLEEEHRALLASQREAELLSDLLVHDMKGPLTTILLGMGIVRDQLRKRPELLALAADLSTADRAGQRLLGMIGDLLSIARLEKGLALRRTPVDVRALLQEVAQSHEAMARRRGALLRVSAPEGLVASLDLELVRRVLDNLAGNALRFLEAGGRLELLGEAVAGGVQLSVRNDGPSIPEPVRRTLFEKFAGGEGRASHNSGLGLYFCRLAAEAHGGTIALVDAPGFTVAFRVTLLS